MVILAGYKYLGNAVFSGTTREIWVNSGEVIGSTNYARDYIRGYAAGFFNPNAGTLTYYTPKYVNSSSLNTVDWNEIIFGDVSLYRLGTPYSKPNAIYGVKVVDGLRLSEWFDTKSGENEKYCLIISCSNSTSSDFLASDNVLYIFTFDIINPPYNTYTYNVTVFKNDGTSTSSTLTATYRTRDNAPARYPESATWRNAGNPINYGWTREGYKPSYWSTTATGTKAYDILDDLTIPANTISYSSGYNIYVIWEKSLNVKVRVGNQWRTASDVYVRVGNNWRKYNELYVAKNGVWRKNG